jgi:PAS domain S-box-containing protein
MNESAADNLKTPLGDLYQTTRVIADTASDAIITIDEDSTMLFVNRATERIFGYSQAELLGKSLTMLIPDYLRLLHRAGNAVELAGLHKSGREVPIELSFGAFTEDGARFYTGIARDISDRRSLERRLAAQFNVACILAESDSLAAAAPVLLQAIGENLVWEMGQLWVVDLAADVMRWFAVWRAPSLDAAEFEAASRDRIFAKGVGLPGRVWKAGVPAWFSDIPTDKNVPRRALAAKAGLRTGVGFPIMLGSEVSGVMEFFSRESQEPDQVLLDMMTGIGHQIGQFVERKRAEEERARIFDLEQRARHEVEAAIDRMARVQTVTEVALSHLSLDKLLAELLERVRDAMDVDTVVILLLEDDNDLVAWATKGLELDVRIRVPLGAGFAGRVAEQKSPMVIDDIETADLYTPFLRQKGVKSLLGVPLLLEGRVLGVIHVGRLVRRPFTDDDTRLLQLVAFRVALAIDHARLFEEERRARREAEAASRAKDEFLTTISHELRTPLTPIIGWIHMIRNGILPDKETVHGLSVIEKNAHALKRLINDLLDMSAILSGKMRMEELPVPMEQMVREAVETVRPLAAARNIDIVVNFHDWHDEIVTGDRARLVQVFWNLLNNAEKFSFPDGRIEVDAEANEREVIVRIQDGGQGIEPDFLPFVFERFRQADGSKTRLHGGLGLGLALVKSFVEAHNGTVTAESPGAGQGSRFTVSLPRHRTQIEGESDQPVQLQSEPAVHLMIVEDDPDTLEMLRATLEARGFRVTACQSAAEALAAAPGNLVDLIISDVGMPEMDGLHMISQLRAIAGYQNIPAIALSGYASRKEAKAALAAGFDAHVSKPVEPAELVIMVNGLLKRTSGEN